MAQSARRDQKAQRSEHTRRSPENSPANSILEGLKDIAVTKAIRNALDNWTKTSLER